MALKVGSSTAGKVGLDKVGQAITPGGTSVAALQYYYRQRRTR